MGDWWSESTCSLEGYAAYYGRPSRWQRFVTWLMNLRFRRCDCRWWWDCGFVPEPGCPYHD